MINDILNERQKTHGDFRDNSWAYMRLIQVLRPRDSTIVESNPVICAALDEIAMKLARISRGDCRFKDHWFDIIGYCTIVLREIDREQTEMQERMG